MLRWTHTPWSDVSAYGAYWVLAVLLPGTLVHRALRGSRGNLPEDVAFGAVTGLLLELVAWAGAAATGTQPLLRWWAAPVVAVFLAVPQLRRHWRIADRRPLPVWWSWLMAAVVLAVLSWAGYGLVTTPLPPVTAVYYQDLMYHLALVHELTRDLPFQVPQLAGEPLRYHYLADAHMAAASRISGVSPATVLLRLWVVPVAAAGAMVLGAFTREVTGRWWTAPIAGAGAFAGLPLALGAPLVPFVAGALVFVSPSQTYVLPFAVLLAALAVDVLRGRLPRAAWLLLPPLALACAGAKSSALPPLLAGLLAAALAGARQPGWLRARWRPVLALLACVLAGTGLGLLLFAGGGAGTLSLRAFSGLTLIGPYQRAPGFWFAVLVVLWYLVLQAPRLLGLALLRRADPVVWLLGGATGAALGATWLLDHPAQSQVYFFAGAVPFGVVLTVRLLSGRMPSPPGHRYPLALVAGLLAGALWVFASPAAPPPADDADWPRALAAPVLRGLAALAGLLLVAGLVWRGTRRTGTRTVLVVVAVAAVLGNSIAAGVGQSVSATARWNAREHAAATDPRRITEGEMRAALWLAAHARPEDVVATNVHCQPVPTRTPCDARAFWVAGLGGHRTLVESWGYSDSAVAADGVGGRGFSFQPPPDPNVYTLNELAFVAPSRELLSALYARQVRWLFADARAGAVAPELGTLAVVRHVSSPVTVYELRG